MTAAAELTGRQVTWQDWSWRQRARCGEVRVGRGSKGIDARRLDPLVGPIIKRLGLAVAGDRFTMTLSAVSAGVI